MNQYSCKHVDIGNFEPGCIVVRVSMILSYGYQASTQLRLQDFDIHLENEPRVGTPIRRVLNASYIMRSTFC